MLPVILYIKQDLYLYGVNMRIDMCIENERRLLIKI